MENQPDDLIAQLKAGGGGKFDIQTYPVARSLTRVNIQPASSLPDNVPSIFGERFHNVFGLLMEFLGAAMIVGVGTLVLAVAVVAALLMLSVLSLGAISSALITTSFFCWVGISLLGGVAVVWYDLQG